MKNLKIVLVFLLMNVGTAMANDSVSWGDVLGSEIVPEWNTPDHRAFDFWVGEWEMTWRGQQPDNFHFDESGSATHQTGLPCIWMARRSWNLPGL